MELASEKHMRTPRQMITFVMIMMNRIINNDCNLRMSNISSSGFPQKKNLGARGYTLTRTILLPGKRPIPHPNLVQPTYISSIKNLKAAFLPRRPGPAQLVQVEFVVIHPFDPSPLLSAT
jgi:hypothetical protein